MEHNHRPSQLLMLIAFASGLGTYVHVRLGVRLSISEFLLPLFLFMAAGASGRPFFPVQRIPAIIGLLLWGGAVVVSDLVNAVEFRETIKGLARPIMIAAFTLYFFHLFSESLEHLKFFIFGAFAGSLLHLAFDTADDISEVTSARMYTYYVYRVTPAVHNLMAIIAYLFYTRWRVFGYVGLTLGVAFTVAYSTRNSAVIGICLLLAFTILPHFKVLPVSSILKPLEMLPRLAILGLLMGTAILYSYMFAASNGYMGEQARQKYLMQTRADFDSDAVKLLVGGRTDAIALSMMIRDKPLLGHGTTSRSGGYYMDAIRIARLPLSQTDITRTLRSEVGFGHSIFLGSWASSGIVSAACWGFIALVILRLLAVLVAARSHLLMLVTILFANFYWDLFFSPLSLQMRCFTGLLIALSVVAVPLFQEAFLRTFAPQDVNNMQPQSSADAVGAR